MKNQFFLSSLITLACFLTLISCREQREKDHCKNYISVYDVIEIYDRTWESKKQFLNDELGFVDDGVYPFQDTLLKSEYICQSYWINPVSLKNTVTIFNNNYSPVSVEYKNSCQGDIFIQELSDSSLFEKIDSTTFKIKDVSDISIAVFKNQKTVILYNQRTSVLSKPRN